MLDLSHVTPYAAFITGILTFFAPCTFIALPTFITYIVNRSAAEGSREDRKAGKQVIFFSTLSFVTGFLIIFFLLGFAASSLGLLLTQNSPVVIRIAGVIIAFFGLFMLFGEHLGKYFKPIRVLFYERKIEVNAERFGNGYLLPFVIGLTTAFAWTACQGPILGGIITFIGLGSASALEGAVYLLIYGLGIMLPFVIVSLTISKSEKLIQKLSKYTPVIYKFTAILLVAIGLGLAFGLTNVSYNLFKNFGYVPK